MKLAQQATGIPVPRIIAPPVMMKAMAGMMGVVEKIIPVPESYSAEYLRVNAGVTYLGTNAKAVRELGYNPRSLEEGLPETLHHEMQFLGMK
jgi:nucleoside-diphosphate-sugar epimerase